MADSTTHDASPEARSTALPALDADAWMRGLIARHAGALRRYAVSQVGPDGADDVVSESFAAAWRDRASFDPTIATERAWLFGIALNRGLAMGRAQRRWRRRAERLLPVDQGGDFTAEADARVDARRDGRAILRALDSLSVQQRAVLLLVACAGLAPSEIAAAMDVPPPTVRSHLARARAVVATVLEEDRDAHE